MIQFDGQTTNYKLMDKTSNKFGMVPFLYILRVIIYRNKFHGCEIILQMHVAVYESYKLTVI